MLTKNTLFLSFLLLSLFSFSQGTNITPSYTPNASPSNVPFPGERCASSYLEDELLRTDSNYIKFRNLIEIQTRRYIQQNSASRAAGVVYTIPVVFHIMHSGEAIGDSTNISFAQAQSCIAALNRDFRRTNADGGIAQSGPLGVDAEIEFCLAQRDPNGNATNGVTRHDMSGDQGYLDSGVYHTAALWRHDASMKAMVQWNPAEYLNVWVVNKIRSTTNIYAGGGGGVIGYATFPGGASSRDGVVIRFSATGNDPTGALGYNLWFATDDGRVLTHELGHYLNLYHTFQSTAACGTSGVNCATIGDRCCDTPPTIVGAGNNCTSPVCPLENKENYMQYQNGACASDFTPDQVARMRVILASTAWWGRNTLVNTNNCIAPPSIDLELDTIFAPIDTICSLTFTPEIVVCNTSATDSVTSFDVRYQVDAGAVSTYNWTGNLQAGECDTFFLPAVTSTNGTHTFTARVDSVNINGAENDINPSNNSKTNNFLLSGSTLAVIQLVSACDSFVSPSGKVFKTNGTYSDTLTNRYGCDSLLSYGVTITSSTVTTINLSGCDSVISPSGKIIKTSGVHYDTVSGPSCDSIFIINTVINYNSIGDTVAFDWARRFGGTNASQGNTVVTDVLGNVYTIGSFQGTSDFDPGAGTNNLTSAGSEDVFISKLDATGNFVWVRRIGGSGLDRGLSITIDNLGYLYATGRFSGSVDFDPGAGTFNLNGGSAGMFILKLDAAGNFVLANAVGGTLEGRAISLDAAGNIYTAGFLGGTGPTDFDPGPGVANFTPAGSIDGFVSKFDATGTFVWARVFGGTYGEQTRGMVADAAGNTYTTGSFNDVVDFDPGVGVFNMTSSVLLNTDIFILKLDPSGNFVWARSIGSPGNDAGNAITIDALGNVYSTGRYVGTTDFDPGAGTSNLTGVGQYDAYVSKLDASGNFVWARAIAGPSYDVGYGITTDAFNKVYVTGSYQSTADFDPGAGTFNLTSSGSNDAFITKLDASGNFAWAKDMKGTSQVISSSVDVDGSGYVYSTGRFQATADFDPSSAVSNLTSAGSFDVFVQKLGQEFLIRDTACGVYTSPTGKSWTVSGIYNDSLVNSLGCDSLLKFDIVILPAPIDTVTDTVCDSTVWRGMTITTSGTYRDTVFATGCDSIFILNIQVDTTIRTLIDTTLCPGDTIVLSNGTVITTTGTYYDTISPMGGGGTMVSTLYSEDFEGTTHSFTLNTPDVSSITPGVNDNAWIVNNSYAGGSFTFFAFPVTVPNTPNQNAAITGNINSNYMHIHSRYAAASTAALTNANYIDGSLGLLMLGQDGMNFSRMTNDISTTGKTNVSFNMYYLCAGSWGRVYYSTNGGTTWTRIGGNLISATWTNFTIANPVFDNQATLRFAVAFNNTDGTAVDPSYGVDEISITSIDTLSGSGCDSITRYDVTVLPVNDTNVFDTICANQPYTLPGGIIPTVSGVYRDTIIAGSIQGCDSIIITNLIINDTSSFTQTLTVCDSLISPSGKIWRASGTFLDTIQNAAGCDSLMTFNLTVVTRVTIVNPITTGCDSAQVNGTWYYSSQTVLDTLTSSTGCDTIVVDSVTINSSSFSINTLTVCDSLVTITGKTFRMSGLFYDTATNSVGCDSLMSYYLTVNYTSRVNVMTTVCDSFVAPSGTIYRTSGTYIDTIPTVGGCDSITSIYLVVDTPQFIVLDTTICHDDSLVLSNGTVINTTGTYFDTVFGTSGTSLLYSEDFEGATHSFTLNTNDTNAITPGIGDNAWIVNNSYNGGTVLATITVPNTPPQNALITGNVNSSYLHIHSRYVQTWSFPSITNSNYIDASIALLGGQSGLNFSKMTNDISTLGQSAVSFEMYYLCRGSYGRLYYSTNSGATWNRVGGNLNNGGNNWSTVNVIDPAFANKATLRFAVGFDNSNGVGSSPGFSVDEIEVRGISSSSSNCDSITQINLIVTQPFRDTLVDTVCDSTVWRGMTITTSGTYTDTVFLACDSIFMLNLQVDTTIRTTVDTTLCPGGTITLLSGTVASTTGTYYDTIATSGCDSIVGYNVTVLPVNDTIIFDTICANQTYTLPLGTIPTMSGTYRDTLVGASTQGCDSIVITNLVINDTTSSVQTLTVCDSLLSPSGKIWRASGTFFDTIQNAAGCDSLMTFNLTVSTTYRDTLVDTVCDSSVWRGMTITTTGIYRDTVFIGCDSIFVLDIQVDTTIRTLIDTNLCPGGTITLLSGTIASTTGIYYDTVATTGCDSIIQYNVIVLPVNDTVVFDTICTNQAYTLPGGIIPTMSGTYRDTLVGASAQGCDSIVITNLVINDTTSSVQTLTVCDSLLSPSGKVWTTSGTYFDTIQNVAGCDSLMTFNLTVSVTTFINETDSACDSLTWRIMTYTTSGTYNDTIVGPGCDTIYVLSLTIFNSVNVSNTVAACDSFVLPSGTVVMLSGTYSDTSTTINGCDSIVNYVVTINTATTSSISPTSCGNYTSPSGKTYTTTGLYSDTVMNASGCDSIISINLTVNLTTTNSVLASGCDTFLLPGGTVATTTGTYRDTLTAANGCDSIIITNLSLGQSSNTTQTFSLCAGQTVTVGSNVYGATGIYNDTFATTLGCDSIIVTNLTINPLTPASITSTTNLCEGSSAVTFTATPAGGKWRGGGIDSTTGLFNPASAGTYIITYTAPGPCGQTDSATVIVYSKPNITANVTDDECDQAQGSIDVTITGGTLPIAYTWNNGATTQDIANLKEGTFTLSVVDGNGCRDSETITVLNISTDDCDYNIFVPNIFSPDGNGENDVLQVEGSGIETLEFIVYNRWGNLVFMSNSQDNGWDGMFKGKPVNQGVFVYYVKGTFVDGKSFNKKGTVTIVR